MNTRLRSTLLAVPALLALAAPATAFAHSQWLLPSETTFSGEEAWVSIDAAVSSELFISNFHSLDPQNFTATGPDGQSVPIENAVKGQVRSMFEVHLTKPGTYRIGSTNTGVFGGYTLNGEKKRLPRGVTADKIASLIPQGATDVQLRENQSTNQVFVTLGVPDNAVFKPTGKGLEMVPVTHPDDLVANEPGVFTFLVDGQPAAGLKVSVTKDDRWAATPIKQDVTTDAKGQAKVTWSGPGMYWMEARASDNKVSIPGATDRGLSYVATLEVQAP
ncbi:DUF4198 domain-containing protein [Novosphingobium sp. 9]|uniref:DUF4198 domain-containing protein n=1 Tax=Novosphingobium sp. 9 TaxID=2025349 RepID=UPI0021B661D7|nr:DUF4198 domain-containing protein [Novosphingobium sp. 9]